MTHNLISISKFRLLLLLLGIVLLVTGVSPTTTGVQAANGGTLQLVGQIGGGPSRGVAIAGNYAYITHPETGLHVINIADPSTPFEVGVVERPHWAEKVAVAGNYAYVTTEGFNMRIVDITNPAAPTEVGVYNTNGLSLDVEVRGNYVYLVDRIQAPWGGLRILDISSPSTPIQVGFFPIDFARPLTVAGNYAYVGTESGVGPLIIDISNPSAPTLALWYDTPGYVVDLAVSGNYAYLAEEYPGGLRILNIANPRQPIDVGFWSAPYGFAVYAVAVSGNYVFLGEMGGLRVFDVSDPTHPSESAFYSTEPIMDLAIVGDYVFVAGYPGALSIFRFTPPTPSDTTPPTTTTNAPVGWQKVNFTISLTCTDNPDGTGCKETKYRIDGGAWQAGNSVSITTEGAHLIEYYSVDNADNQETTKSAHAKLDKTVPAITWIGGINDGDNFYFGFVPPEPTCTASDNLSGVDGLCSVSGYASPVGPHTLTAMAKDYAGNEATGTRGYTVIAWELEGFYPPVDMNGVYNIVKNGSTVPLKFEVFAGPTELTDIAYIKGLSYAQTSCDANATMDDIETTATGGTSLRYDTTAGQFIYNWKTPSTVGKCYRVTMTTVDCTSLVAYFKLK